MYQDLAREQTLQQLERLGKKASQESLDLRARVMLSGGTGNGIAGSSVLGDAFDGEALLAKLGAGSLVDGSLVEPELDDIFLRSSKKRKADGKESGSEADDAHEAEGFHEAADDPKTKAASWFDSETKVNGAIRRYEKLTGRIRAALEQIRGKMVETLGEVPSSDKECPPGLGMSMFSTVCRLRVFGSIDFGGLGVRAGTQPES